MCSLVPSWISILTSRVCWASSENRKLNLLISMKCAWLTLWNLEKKRLTCSHVLTDVVFRAQAYTCYTYTQWKEHGRKKMSCVVFWLFWYNFSSISLSSVKCCGLSGEVQWAEFFNRIIHMRNKYEREKESEWTSQKWIRISSVLCVLFVINLPSIIQFG